MSTQSEIGQIQELLDERVDLLSMIQCKIQFEKSCYDERVRLCYITSHLYELTNDPKYKI